MAKEAKDAHSEIYDLSNKIARSTVAVIDALTQRGAFKGEELSTIGQLRDQSLQIIQLAESYQQEAAADS
ncbi:hypothetical protein N8864_04635 [Gammaproteobacteria bacterium]|nr:hypothetical protein [Gammaproteobacteria bacterium]|tara:strand:- start:824 stop:1033 length:210 start_codon:yes stop_codon:yes gene_type:complete